MADERFGIIVEINPSQPVSAMGQVDGAMLRSEQAAKRAAREVDRAWAQVAKAAAAEARAAASAQEDHARHVTQTVQRQARERAAAERDASRAAAAAARQAAREQQLAARAASAAQEAASRKTAETAAAASRSAKEQADRLKAAYREIVGPAADFNRKLSEANALMRQGAISSQQYAAHIRGLQREAQNFRPGGGGGGLGGLLSTPLGGQIAGVASVGAFVGAAKGALELSDSYANLTSRLITLTGSEAAAIPLREKLLQVAVDTKTENGSIVELYARIAGAVKELGVTEAETISFTRRLTESFKISGASTIAQQQAMIQLAQGLGAGALRGEEFNSVLEAAPNIIDIVGQHIGKTRGEMRAMAELGALTTRTIMDAFEAAGSEIDGKFNRRIVTSSEQWVGFKNRVEVAVGEIGRSVDISKGAAAAFDVLNKAVDDAAFVLQGAIATWKEWNDLTGGMQGAVAKAAMAPGIALQYVSAVKNVSNLFAGTSIGDATYTQALIAHNQIVEAGTAAMVARHDAIQQALRDYREGIGVLDEFGRAFKRGDTGLEAEDAYSAFLTKRNAEARRARILAGKPAPERILPGGFVIPGDNPNRMEQREALDAERDRTIKAQEEARRRREQTMKQLEGLRSSLDSVYAAELQLTNAEELLGRAQRSGLVTREQSVAIYDALKVRLKDQLDPYQAVIDKINRETDALDLSESARRRDASVRSIVLDLQAKGVTLSAQELSDLRTAVSWQEAKAKTLADQKAVLEAIRGPQQQMNEQVAIANDLFYSGEITGAEYNKFIDQFRAKTVAVTDYLTESLKNVPKSEIVELAELLENKLGDALGKTLDALVDFANGAKVSFHDMFVSILADLEKTLIRLLAFQAIKATIGIGDGSLGGILAGALGFGGSRAAGGDFVVPNNGRGTDGVPMLFNVTPGEHIRFTPPGQQATQQGAAPVVNFKAVNVFDLHGATVESMGSADGEQVFLNFIGRNAGKIRAALS